MGRPQAILLDSISNISLITASLTKSAVVGAMPSAEFTPVFSPTDWAKAADDKSTVAAANVAIDLLMTSPF
jgi:hypothetical protein